MDLSLFGIQGCGKGTHAKLLAAEFDYDIFGVGNELRKLSTQDSEKGREVKALIDKGHLAPTEVVMQVATDWIDAHAGRKIIFDAIPRSLEQLEPFNKILEERGRSLMGIHIKIDENHAMERILKRASGRIDDATEESIRRRLQVFRETTMPVINWYAQHHGMVEVDGDAPVEVVYERIREALAL